jgi:CDP-diglyceride synthetase
LLHIFLCCSKSFSRYRLLLFIYIYLWDLFGFNLFQIKRQIHAVNEVYRLHKLPEFYKVRLLSLLFINLFIYLSWYFLEYTAKRKLQRFFYSKLLCLCFMFRRLVYHPGFSITGSTTPYILSLGIGWQQRFPTESGWRRNEEI